MHYDNARLTLETIKKRLSLLWLIIKTGDVIQLNRVSFILTTNFTKIQIVYNVMRIDKSKVSDRIDHFVIKKNLHRKIWSLFRRDESLCYAISAFKTKIDSALLTREGQLSVVVGIDKQLALLLMSINLGDDLSNLSRMPLKEFITKCNTLSNIET